MRYFPLAMPVAIAAERTNLLRLDFLNKTGMLSADFALPDDTQTCLRVDFSGVATFRVVDEMPLSTEEPVLDPEGLIPGHVAYRVEDGYFWRVQSETFRSVSSGLQHYQFVTGFMCLDALSNQAPIFSVVKIISAPDGTAPPGL